MQNRLRIFVVLVLGLLGNSVGQICSVAPPIKPRPSAPAKSTEAGRNAEAPLLDASDFLVDDADLVDIRDRDESGLRIVGIWEVDRRRMNKIEALRVPAFIEDCGWIVGSSIRLKIVVDDQGNVVSATPIKRERDQFTEHIYDLAQSIARAQRFRPFEDHGKPASVTFRQSINVLPLEELPATHVPFPKIRDLRSLRISLKHSAYELEIRGTGSLIFTTTNNGFFVSGTHRDQISREGILSILDAFKAADFFSLRAGYAFKTGSENCLASSISINIGNRSKSVEECDGEKSGMPESITGLKETIERIADVDKWLWGNLETVPSLVREGFDFRSVEAADMLCRTSDLRILQGLLDAGTSPKGKDSEGKTPLYHAVQRDDIQWVRMLIKYGADPNAVTTEGDTILMSAARAGVPEIIAEILKYKPDVNARNSYDETIIQLAVRGYFHGVSVVRIGDPTPDRAEVVRLLARAGADLNTQNEEGKTPLHYAGDIEVVKSLVQNGANVNLRDEDGDTPLLNTSSPEIAKALLEAGADVSITDDWGHTALDIARINAAQARVSDDEDDPDAKPDDIPEKVKRPTLVEVLEAATQAQARYQANSKKPN